MSAKSAMDLVKEAKQDIQNLSPQQVQDERSAGATLIDIRGGEERTQNGAIGGSVHASRGMLEFYADLSLSYHKPETVYLRGRLLKI